MSRYQKGKTNLDFTEARDSERQWHQLGHISGADNCIYQKNRSNCHTSTKIGRHMHYSLLFHNKTLATQIFKMAAIFQDGRHFRYVTPYNSDIVGSSGALP